MAYPRYYCHGFFIGWFNQGTNLYPFATGGPDTFGVPNSGRRGFSIVTDLK